MKRFLFTVYATVSLGCFFGKAQVSRSNLAVVPNNPTTQPLNISQFEVSGRLITQNFFAGTAAIPVANQTGNFATTARWNSMGSLNAGSQVLNGFRTQTNGRGLTMGYSILGVTAINPTGTNTNQPSNNPTIQWIGNAANGAVTPGNLEFKYALNPGAPGVPAGDANIFTMAPASSTIPSFNYATTDALVGQLQSGTFGSFGVGDTWSATGQITVPTPVNLTTYGARQQFQGSTLITGLLRDNVSGSTNAVMDFGAPSSLRSFKFRAFYDPTIPSSVRNVWQSSIKFGNVLMSRQEITANNSGNFYLSVVDGFAPTASATGTTFVARSAIYATGDGNVDPTIGNVTPISTPSPLNSFAAITGDVSEATNPGVNYALLGITSSSRLRFNDFAGYFIGNVG